MNMNRFTVVTILAIALSQMTASLQEAD